jgi:phosphatidylglycerol:prolipoprotein diacylglycerol transferase
MHPVLVVVPWPELGLPLWPLFVLLGLSGAGIGFTAFRRRERAIAALGAVLAAAGLALAVTSRTSRLVSGSFELRSWGALFVAALLLGSAVTLRRGARRGFEREFLVRACIAAGLGGVLGARLVWVLLHPSATGSVEGAFAFYRGGLSVWGGLAGGLVGAKLATGASGASLCALADLAAPGLALGIAVARLGCFLEGCDFGVPLGGGAPGVLASLGTFPAHSPAWVAHVVSQDLTPDASRSLAVHPVMLYEAVGTVVLVAVALLMERRTLRPGFVFATVSFAYLLLRVSLDALREGSADMWVSRVLLLFVTLIGAAVPGIRFLRARNPAVARKK